MATTTLKGVNRTAAVAVPSTKALNGQQHGKVHAIIDQYTWAADSVINDVVTLGASAIPLGATVINAVISCVNDNGTAGKYSLGWAASADGTTEAAQVAGFILDFNPVSTGGNVAQADGGGPATTAIATVGVLKTFLADCFITLKCTEASNVGTGSLVFNVAVTYVTD